MKSRKSKLTEEEVRHIAKLANLSLDEEEVKKFQKQLSETLAYVNILNRLDTTGVELTGQVTGLSNIFRKDLVHESIPQNEALSGTSSKSKGFFKVKVVLEK